LVESAPAYLLGPECRRSQFGDTGPNRVDELALFAVPDRDDNDVFERIEVAPLAVAQRQPDRVERLRAGEDRPD
jgi:hypothetical protein